MSEGRGRVPAGTFAEAPSAEGHRSDLAAPFDTLLSDVKRTDSAAGQTQVAPAARLQACSNSSAPEERILRGASRMRRANKALSVKQLNLVADSGFEPATSGL